MSPAYKQSGTSADDNDEAAILKELRERYDYATTQWSPIYNEGDTDVKYLCGETWDENDRNARVGRLTLKFDQLNQYLNQLVNAIRQNKRAVKVTPEGNGANDQTANLRANRIRQIEYLSNAPEVYTSMFSGAAERSFGYARIVAEYEKRSRNKCLRLKSIPNPNQVLPDPDDQSVTGRGWKYLFFRYPMLRKEFQRDYPDAKTGDYSRDAMSGVSNVWGDKEHVLVCEYWTVKIVEKMLYFFTMPDGSERGFYEDEIDRLPPDAVPSGEPRLDAVPTVCSYLTNGIELLAKKGKPAKTEWPGSTIPFIGCFGKIMYRNEQGITTKVILSFIRLARDAQKYYNWLKSTEGEVISMPSKAPYFAYRGQMNDDELALLKLSVSQPVAVITAGAMTEMTGGTVLPLPQHNIPDLPIQAFEIAAEAARRDIQNAVGRYNSSIGKGDSGVHSGVQQQQLDKQSDQGSYHLVDNFDASVREVGVKLDELLPFYDDTRKTVTTRLPNDDVEQVKINDPNDADALDMTQGDHVVTISTGPDFDSEREVANAFADALVQHIDSIAKVAGPEAAKSLLALSVKLKNIGPLGDSMADLLDPKPGKDGKPNPQQLQQQLQQMQGQLQHAEQVMKQMHDELQVEKAGNAKDIEKANIDKDRAIEVAKIQFASAANVADIKADMEHSLLAMQAQVQTLQTMFGARQAEMDATRDAGTQQATLAAQQAHEREMAQSGQVADAQSQQAAQAHAAEMADAGHANALEQQQQAAALAPKPEPQA